MPAKYSILTDSRKLIPAKCKKFREWTDSRKFLDAKISDIKVFKIARQPLEL